MTQTVASAEAKKKPRRFQFGLRAMFMITAFVAIIFSIYYYYFGFRFQVTDRTFLIDAESVRLLLAKKSGDVVREISSDNVIRLVLTNEEYEHFQKDNPHCCIVNISGVNTTRIGGIETKFESTTTNTQFPFHKKGRTQVSRISHSEFMFKLSFDASYRNTDFIDKTFTSKIKYDGPIPKGHMIFIAPADDYYIVFAYQVISD